MIFFLVGWGGGGRSVIDLLKYCINLSIAFYMFQSWGVGGGIWGLKSRKSAILKILQKQYIKRSGGNHVRIPASQRHQ